MDRLARRYRDFVSDTFHGQIDVAARAAVAGVGRRLWRLEIGGKSARPARPADWTGSIRRFAAPRPARSVRFPPSRSSIAGKRQTPPPPAEATDSEKVEIKVDELSVRVAGCNLAIRAWRRTGREGRLERRPGLN